MCDDHSAYLSQHPSPPFIIPPSPLTNTTKRFLLNTGFHICRTLHILAGGCARDTRPRHELQVECTMEAGLRWAAER